MECGKEMGAGKPEFTVVSRGGNKIGSCVVEKSEIKASLDL